MKITLMGLSIHVRSRHCKKADSFQKTNFLKWVKTCTGALECTFLDISEYLDWISMMASKDWIDSLLLGR